MRILISGFGSIGRQHFWTLKKVFGFDPIVYRRAESPDHSDLRYTSVFHNFDEALDSKPDVVVICSPTALHIEQAIAAARAGCHLYIEKPLSNNLERIDELKNLTDSKSLKVMVGYMMRFHPHIIKLKEKIQSQQFGKVTGYRSIWSEYLPNWHPWEDYRASYASRKELGGGAFLTLSHDIDLAIWLLGNLTPTQCELLMNGPLEMDVEQKVQLQLQTKCNAPADVTLSYLAEPQQRTLTVDFETACIEFDYYKSELKTAITNNDFKVETLDEFQRSQLFISSFEYFFRCIQKDQPPKPSIEDSFEVLSLIKTSCRMASQIK